jgi:hypothetical protein
MPAARGRKGAQDEAITPADARRLIAIKNETGRFPSEDLLRLLGCDQPVCTHGCPKPRKDNPNCLCGLTPAPGSFRKKGLWTKEPAALAQLGPDPNLWKRQVRGAPRAQWGV